MRWRLFTAMVALAGCDAGSGVVREACMSLPEARSAVVARVGEQAIDTNHLLARLREQGPDAVGRYGDALRLKRFVEDQVRFELLVQAARERGLDRDPDVVEAARKVMVRKLLLQDLGTQAMGGAADEEAVRAYYEAHKDEYAQPQARRLAHIQLAPTADGKARAQHLIDILRQKDDASRKLWKLTAVKESEDAATKSRGGELGTFMTQEKLAAELGPSFAQTIFAAPVGEVLTSPVQSVRGWHVVVVLADKAAQVQTLEEARVDIQEKLLAGQRSKRFENYLRELRQRHPVAVYEDQLPQLLSAFVGVKEAP